MKYLFLACILFSLNALAEVPIHPLGSFEAVQSGDGEHCHGYSIDLWQKSDTEVFGIFNHHVGLCGDPACSVLTGSYKDGYINFSTKQPIYDKKYSFNGLINKNKQLVGRLNNVDLSLKSESNTLGMKTETLNQWCSLWEQVPRCKGVREYCAQSLNRPVSGSPYKWKSIGNNCQITSDDGYNKKLDKFASLLFGKPSSIQIGCVTNPYLASEYSQYQPGIENHAGLDLKSDGDKVYAPYNGTVVLQDLDLTKGKSTLTIYSKYAGINTMLLHCKSHMGLKKGDLVKKGDVVCITGDVGANAPHLHVEVKAINMDAENLKAMSANRGVCKGSSFVKSFDSVTKKEVIEDGCSYYDVRENTFDPTFILDLLKNDPQVNVSENSNMWLFKDQPDFELNPSESKEGFTFTKDGEVSYRGQTIKPKPKLAKEYFESGDSVHIYYSPEKTNALLIYKTTVWGGILSSLVDLKNQKVLMRKIVNSHGVGLNGVSWSAGGEYLAFAFVSALETQYELAILGAENLDLYRLKPLNIPEKAGFIPKQESIKWKDNSTIEVDFNITIANYDSEGKPETQNSTTLKVAQKLSKDTKSWIIQENPSYELKLGEIKNNFKFNRSGEVTFGGNVLFPKTKRIDAYTVLKVYISPTNPSKALVAFRDWDYGVLRAAIVDLNNKTVISNQLIPESSVRGIGHENILTIFDHIFSWSPDGRYVAMPISPGEYQANLAVVSLTLGEIKQYVSSGLKDHQLNFPDMKSLKWIGGNSLQVTFEIAEVDDYGNLTESQLSKAYSIAETITSSELPGSALGKQPATSIIKKESSQEAQNTKNEFLAKVNYLYLEMKKKANEFINSIGIASETTKTVESKIQGNVAGNKTDLQNPPKKYLNWGACPFECCVYREWVAKEPVKIYQDREESSPVVATLNMNESVNALTGVVVTQKVGRAKILMPITVWKNSKSISPSEVAIKKGEIIYPLHYEGEGYSAFWYKGQIYSGELVDAKKVNIEQLYQYDWWAQIKTKNGEIGWTKQTNVFASQDACG